MCRKTPLLTVGSRSSTGSEFQTVGPPTEKARRPSVLRRYRGMIKWCRLADRRCRLVTSTTAVLDPHQSCNIDNDVDKMTLCSRLLYTLWCFMPCLWLCCTSPMCELKFSLVLMLSEESVTSSLRSNVLQKICILAFLAARCKLFSSWVHTSDKWLTSCHCW